MKKPIIIILTSHEEAWGTSRDVAQDVEFLGDFAAVVIGDDKYGMAPRGTELRRLMDGGRQYASKLRATVKGRIKPFSRRIRRIGNMIRRFKPVLILALTPYAHFSVMEAKRRLGSTVPIAYALPSFTMPESGAYSATDAFIVENDNIKSQLVRYGISADRVFTLGMPYRPADVSSARLASVKRDAGAEGGPLAYVSVGEKRLASVLKLLADQGDIATYAVRITKSEQQDALGSVMGDVKATFVPAGERAEEYMCAADIAVIDYDAAVVCKLMRLGVPFIILSDDKRAAADVNYLASKELCLVAERDIDVVTRLYELLDPRRMFAIKQNMAKYCAATDPQDIARFATTYAQNVCKKQ